MGSALAGASCELDRTLQEAMIHIERVLHPSPIRLTSITFNVFASLFSSSITSQET